jgi:hypothetical protein
VTPWATGRDRRHVMDDPADTATLLPEATLQQTVCTSATALMGPCLHPRMVGRRARVTSVTSMRARLPHGCRHSYGKEALWRSAGGRRV